MNIMLSYYYNNFNNISTYCNYYQKVRLEVLQLLKLLQDVLLWLQLLLELLRESWLWRVIGNWESWLWLW